MAPPLYTSRRGAAVEVAMKKRSGESRARVGFRSTACQRRYCARCSSERRMEGGCEGRDAGWASPAALFNRPDGHQSSHVRTHTRSGAPQQTRVGPPAPSLHAGLHGASPPVRPMHKKIHGGHAVGRKRAIPRLWPPALPMRGDVAHGAPLATAGDPTGREGTAGAALTRSRREGRRAVRPTMGEADARDYN